MSDLGKTCSLEERGSSKSLDLARCPQSGARGTRPRLWLEDSSGFERRNFMTQAYVGTSASV